MRTSLMTTSSSTRSTRLIRFASITKQVRKRTRESQQQQKSITTARLNFYAFLNSPGALSLTKNFTAATTSTAFTGSVIVSDGIFSNKIPFNVRVVKERREDFNFLDCSGGGARMSVYENASVSTLIGSMQTTPSGDSPDVTYTIETSSGDSSRIRVDALNGNLYTEDSIERNLLTSDVILLTMTARNGQGQ